MRIVIQNWARFQHYKSRRPPWVKLHRSLLDNRQWHTLTPVASKLLVECWVLASESIDGSISGKIEDIAFRLHRDPSQLHPIFQELSLQDFIDIIDEDDSLTLASDSTVISPSYHSAPENVPETEAETETKAKAKTKTKKTRVYSKEFEKVWKIHRRGPKADAYNEYRKAVPDLISHDDLVSSLKIYIQSFNHSFQGVHLWRYINKSRWEEIPETPGVLKRQVVLGPTSPVLL